MINVKTDHGAVGNGTNDDTAAINAAIAVGSSEIYFPSGKYLVTSPLTALSYGGSSVTEDNDRITFRGDGMFNTQINYANTTGGTLISITGGEMGDANFTGFRISDMSLTSNGNGEAIKTNISPYSHFERVYIGGWGTGLNLENCDFAVIDKCLIRWNTRGVYAIEEGESSYRTRPNKISIRDSSISLNDDYGVWLVEPGTTLLDGCDFGNNGQGGQGGSRFGVKIENAAPEGGGINVTNCYFEENKNIADLWILTTATNNVYEGMHNILNNSFNRTGVGGISPATCNILVQLDADIAQRVHLAGNSFKVYDGYVSGHSGTTRYTCLFDGTGPRQYANTWNFLAYANYQQDGPNIVTFPTDRF